MSDEDIRARLGAQGWKARELPGFIGTAGPLWTRREEQGWAYGILCGPGHLNPAGLVHGGLLATLLDHVVSTVAWEACGRQPCITLQLDAQYLGAVREGQFVQARATVVRTTAGLVFMRGSVCVEDAEVACAQAVLKVRKPG